MLDDFSYQLSQQGLSMNQYFKFTGQDRDAMMEQVKPEAIKRIKTSLIVEAVAKAEDIKATDEEVEERMKETAERYQLDVEKFKELAGEKEEEAIRMDLSMEKAIKFIADNAKEV
jgi:trigger factor